MCARVESYEAGEKKCISDVRRTFCLFVTFDLLFITMLWIIELNVRCVFVIDVCQRVKVCVTGRYVFTTDEMVGCVGATDRKLNVLLFQTFALTANSHNEIRPKLLDSESS